MAAEKSGKKVDRRKAKAPSERQKKVVKARAEGKTYKEAGIEAGYPAANAKQSAFQAIAGLRGRVATLLEEAGLSEQIAIDKHLLPALEANETIFFQKDGRVKQRVDVINWTTRMAALRMLFELHGSYAPRDPEEAAQYGVRIIHSRIHQASSISSSM